ncbi:MAG: hypothetical protein R3F11_04225 [Verrucomicrobiales bacterium]
MDLCPIHRRLFQLASCAGTVFLLTIVTCLFVDREATDVMDALMTPWFSICLELAPSDWQNEPNIALGIICLLSGIAVYSMLIGGFGSLILAAAERLRKPKKNLGNHQKR